jgi:hypothetical protein
MEQIFSMCEGMSTATNNDDVLGHLQGRLAELAKMRECGEVCLELRDAARWSEREVREIREDMELISVEVTEIVVRIAMMRREKSV